MSIQKNMKVVVQDEKSEFLMELMEGRNKWAGRQPKYATAYERMICIFTTPEKEENDNKKTNT